MTLTNVLLLEVSLQKIPLILRVLKAGILISNLLVTTRTLKGVTPVTRGYRAERVITDPLATTTGLAFFTTYKPYSDECGLGGKSFIWGVRYNTGGAGGALLKGTALLQVSTGSIEQINLSQALSEMGGRRTSALEGVPPTAQGLSLLSPPPPVKRTIHIKER